jgi:hypothetical protein
MRAGSRNQIINGSIGATKHVMPVEKQSKNFMGSVNIEGLLRKSGRAFQG